MRSAMSRCTMCGVAAVVAQRTCLGCDEPRCKGCMPYPENPCRQCDPAQKRDEVLCSACDKVFLSIGAGSRAPCSRCNEYRCTLCHTMGFAMCHACSEALCDCCGIVNFQAYDHLGRPALQCRICDQPGCRTRRMPSDPPNNVCSSCVRRVESQLLAISSSAQGASDTNVYISCAQCSRRIPIGTGRPVMCTRCTHSFCQDDCATPAVFVSARGIQSAGWFCEPCGTLEFRSGRVTEKSSFTC